jgi:hypothetical protein
LLFNSILALVMLPLATAKIWQSARGLPVIERDALRRHVTALLIGGMQPGPHTASAQAQVQMQAPAQQPKQKPPSGRRNHKDADPGSQS